MDKFDKDFKDIQSKVDTIYKYIVGHDELEQQGIIHWKKDSENRLQVLEEFKNRIIWISVGMSIPTGLGILKIVQYFSQFLK